MSVTQVHALDALAKVFLQALDQLVLSEDAVVCKHDVMKNEPLKETDPVLDPAGVHRTARISERSEHDRSVSDGRVVGHDPALLVAKLRG